MEDQPSQLQQRSKRAAYKEKMQAELDVRVALGTRWTLVGALAVSALCYVVLSWHWMLIWDSPIMHYVNFLMNHGMKPYSDITDNNLPGSYLTEAWAMHVFGAGDLGWRLYDFFLLGTVTAAMVTIARPYDWAAGAFAGGMFLLLHGKEGPLFAGEREQVMTVLIMVGYAAMFLGVRRSQPWWMLGMGFCTAFAASIKPTVAPLSLVLLLIAVLVVRRRGIAWVPYLLYGLVGMATATALNVGYLAWHHAWHDFLFTQRIITPYYVALQKEPMRVLMKELLPPIFWPITVWGVVLAVTQRRWTWEQWTLALGAAVGLASYIQQHKGFQYHRYMFATFLLLLVGIELMRALRRRGPVQWVSVGVVALVVLVYVPYAIRTIYRVPIHSDLTLAMEADLNRLGGPDKLQGQVQCLDLVWGCLNALYHLQMVENTGFTGDMVIFDPHDGPARRYHRAMWTRLAEADPANVLVMTNEYFQGVNTYNKVDNWPEYKQYMNANYTLVVERAFPEELGAKLWTTDPRSERGYRIYIRKGSSLLGVRLPPSSGTVGAGG